MSSTSHRLFKGNEKPNLDQIFSTDVDKQIKYVSSFLWEIKVMKLDYVFDHWIVQLTITGTFPQSFVFISNFSFLILMLRFAQRALTMH